MGSSIWCQHKVGQLTSGEMYTEYHDCFDHKAGLYPTDKGGGFSLKIISVPTIGYPGGLERGGLWIRKGKSSLCRLKGS